MRYQNIKKLSKTAVLLLIALFFTACLQSENVSPFASMKWDGDKLSVLIGQEWFFLTAVDRVPFNEMCSKLKAQSYAWRSELLEEFKATLDRSGYEVGSTVSVKVVDRLGNETTKSLKLSKDNYRQNIVEVHGYPVKQTAPLKAVTGYDFLKSEPLKEAEMGLGPKEALSFSLSAQEALNYLDRLQGIIENNYSYLQKFDGDYREALGVLRSTLNSDIFQADLESKVSKFVALFGDGHAGYMTSQASYNQQFLPFLVKRTKEGITAFRTDRKSLLDSEYPLLAKLDDIDIAKWIEKARLYTPRGSRQFVDSTSIRKLREINQLRLELKQALKKTIKVELRSLDQTRSKVVEMDLSPTKPQYGAGYDKKSRVLSGNIGYLRIQKMEKSSREVVEAMSRFKQTDGLIIDVRGNGGGNRRILVDLMPYFLEPDEFYLSNVAKYWLKPLDEKDVSEGYLEDRFLYPISSSRFNEDEKEKLRRFIERFHPELDCSDPHFSDWHFMVHQKSDNPDSFHYDRPVMVLMDSDCFSASDIFLNAFKGRQEVTLIGTPSGGGSGRSFLYFFGGKSINILSLSTMISFKTNGELIEGRGVEPDLFVEESFTDFVGTTDLALEQALRLLKK